MLTDEVLSAAKILWNYHKRIDVLDKLSTNRLILGLGSYDLRVADYCAELFMRGYGDKILFTGDKGNWTVGRWDKTEAEMFKEQAVLAAVPEGNILIETKATNIGENIKYSRDIIKKGFPQLREIILVTKPNTTRRAYTTFMALWPAMKLRVSAPFHELEDVAECYSLENLISELVGDIERIVEYPAKGFQVYQEVPEPVMMAYRNLKAAGFTKHCIY